MQGSKYWQRYAEPEARLAQLAELRAFGPWPHAVALPVRREGLDCLDCVANVGRVLVVLVVNAGEDGEDQRVNAALIHALEARAAPVWTAPGLSLHRLAPVDVLLVDRSRPPRSFGPRDGVGLARKLGGDLIARLITDGHVESPWIHTTDADAELPAAHFERVAALAPERVGAAVAPFRHVDAGDPQVYAATLRYELSLRYYVLGLRSAGSAHAFHSIGSLISVPATRYIQARGFPRRLAGEDFYMLDKLAKLGPIAQLGGEPVRLRARRSSRAPFGTGPAVERLLAGAPLEVYDPRVFAALARAIRAIDELDFSDLDDLPELASWSERAEAIARRSPATQRRTRMLEHFDGFRTLKLIHALSVRWPKRPWPEALANAAFLTLDPELALEAQRDHLAQLETSMPPPRPYIVSHGSPP